MAILNLGIDVIGRIAPMALNRHEYIFVAIDYFTKWVEVVSYFVLKAKHMARLLINQFIMQTRDNTNKSPIN